ncbi:MAG TPA: hypothetical protein VKI23_02260, partial [Cellulomonadaceae bacterium]|nr:hypothetical protein [Cellulomonadaceae bacterium]
MIQHRPHGLGHAYRPEPDQRVPARPIESEPIILGATTDAGATDLSVELTIEGRTQRLALRPVAAARGPAEGAGAGHLAAAAIRQVGWGRRAWSVRLDPLVAGTHVAYRFVADDRRQRTRRFDFVVAGWSSVGGRLAAEKVGPTSDRIVPGSVAWLRADGGPIRVRFAFRLAVGERVIGFGERFDRLDQRGRRLDATVFEQYKSQGARTYMPMPFVIVVGGDGWGFHVRTSRRSWYDVGVTDPDRLWVEVELDPDEPDPEVGIALYGGAPA